MLDDYLPNILLNHIMSNLCHHAFASRPAVMYLRNYLKYQSLHQMPSGGSVRAWPEIDLRLSTAMSPRDFALYIWRVFHSLDDWIPYDFYLDGITLYLHSKQPLRIQCSACI